MDEESRRLERSSRASGDRIASVRAAHEHLRAARFEAALAALGPEPAHDDAAHDEERSVEVRGLEVTTRALALTGLGRHESALLVLEAAFARGAAVELDTAALLEALAASIAGKTPLGRARAARLLGRAPSRPELEPLRADRDPLVRLALLTERPTFTPDERVSRVYGSHGGDYETGHFIAFDVPLDIRLRVFEPRLFTGVSTALSTLAHDPHMVETLELKTAFGDGWGLGGNAHPIDVGVLDVAIAAFNALDLVPWRLRHCGERPYDLMEDEARLVRRLARDVGGHPVGRQAPYDPGAPLLARLLAKHPYKGPPCPRAEIAPLLDEARRVFTPLGASACEEFARQARAELKH